MELNSLLSLLHSDETGENVASLLRQITAELLLGHYFEVCGVRCYPLELESYFYRGGVFEDPYVHDNALQQNRFGSLYVHRLGTAADSAYKMDNRVCVGVCVSDSDDYYYSLLIRSAQFDDGTRAFGPNNVLTHWARKVNAVCGAIPDAAFDALRPGGRALVPLLPELEAVPALRVLSPTDADPRDHEALVFSRRVGLGDRSPAYRDLPLRGVTGTLRGDFAFKDKTALLRDYLADLHLTGEAAVEAAREIHGSVPSWVTTL